MARLKADNFSGYRSKDQRRHPSNNRDEADLRRKLDDDRHRDLVKPGGSWWNFVHMFLAEQVGDAGTVARLKAENRASLMRSLLS